MTERTTLGPESRGTPGMGWRHPISFSDSSALSSCHSRVYQSLANLIRWADQVMLDGIDLEDKENVTSVTNVIKAVLDGVKVRPLLTRCVLLRCIYRGG